jgi:DNA-binding NtrC family response regulator
MRIIRYLDHSKTVKYALELNGGNQTHAAEQLQIGSATLYRKLRSYGSLKKKNVRRAGPRP